MTSDEYPLLPPNGENPPSEQPAASERVEPYTNAYEPVQPATNSYPPQSGQPYHPYGYGSQFEPQQVTRAYPDPSAQGAQPNYPAPQSYPAYQAYDPQLSPQGGYPLAGQPAGYGPPPTNPEATSGGRRRRPMILIALLAALLGGGVGGGIVAIADHNSGNSVNTGLKITNSTGAPAAQLNGTVGAAAAKIRPSVVTIDVTGQQESGTGSGVIIRNDGYILTNDHVVDIGSGSGDIQVVLSDGRTAAAKVVGRDTPDDLAVVKVDGLSNLTAATFAKSSTLSVGQAVVAVGAPLGLSDTVTSGIVSNVARPVRAGDNDQAVFQAVQTDAAINPGNSGGPLVDLNGSVVGINAAIASDNSGGGGLQIPGQPAQQAGNIGIGFAIPADEASRIAGELIASGKATHAVLGVEVNGPAATGSSTVVGVPLHTVTAGGVADKAGLKTGDVVTQIDDQRVTTSDALIAAVRSHAPGDQVKVSYDRGGKSNVATVTLGSSNS
ncbi:MAG: trypsin-like peptidase domain-containing protein [Actinomycetota bacterium]|nr:trypsin-like peptidase domain-containing protein [Actinomycetota bacterium]MDQ2955346.1 trypsin-like peptidase domain-containing protein [Actinomycetota bacterium]